MVSAQKPFQISKNICAFFDNHFPGYRISIAYLFEPFKNNRNCHVLLNAVELLGYENVEPKVFNFSTRITYTESPVFMIYDSSL